MIIALDNETHLIGPGQVAPRLVCVSIAYDDNRADVLHRRDPACRRTVLQLLEDSEITLGGHNFPYDAAVWVAQWPELLPLVFQLFEKDRVLDTQVRQKLLDIAHGEYRGRRNVLTGEWEKYEYNLAALAKRHAYPVDLDKDTWRLRYSEFDDVPVESWPQGAVDYSRHDALATRWVLTRQVMVGPNGESVDHYLVDQHRQMRAFWALHLVSAWGVRTDRTMVERLKKRTIERIESHKMTLCKEGLLTQNRDGTYKREMKKALEYAAVNVENPQYTDKGRISLSADAVSTYGDPLLTALQEYGSASTVMSRVEELEAGVDVPIHTRFDELMDTGRTSSSKPNIQNRWAGNKPDEFGFGDRECFVPREGNVFLISDVPGLELRCCAQVCINSVGFSRMGEVLRAGGDPHLEVAAQLLGISMEEARRRKKDPLDSEIYLARQTGKVANFGLNAGLGWMGLIEQARTKYEVILTPAEAKKLIRVWKETWPEFEEFFKWVKSLCGGADSATIFHYGSERYRGFIPYTVVCNTFSQGMGADATKSALWALVKECYVGTLSPSRVVNYIHDEYIMETPEENLTEKAQTMGRIIADSCNEWFPDIPISYEDMAPLATRRWSKLAKRIVKDGELQVWEWDVATQEGSPGYAH